MKIKIMRGVIYLLIALSLVAVFNQQAVNVSYARGLLNIAAPSIASPQWLNSTPLDNNALKGKVYLVEFWTFGCYNCRNVEPYVKNWYAKYHAQGFEVIAVHTPEFAHEARLENVKTYLKKNSINYPVAIDDDFSIWNRFSNRYWPAMYLVDKKGVLRYYHFGEGEYETTQQMIETLLQE